MESWTCLQSLFPVLGLSFSETVTYRVPARADGVTEAVLMPAPVFPPQMQSPHESRTGGVRPRDPEPNKREAERFLRDGGLSAKEEWVRGASSLGETPSPPSTPLGL